MSSPQTLTHLQPLIEILDAFIHRHKNQHGSSHWFRYVPILRRSLRSLLKTQTCIVPSTKAAASQGARLQRHAKWLHSKVLPRCFLAFSQLAADNQHAPIGLLLLALIARVNTALKDILPLPAQPAFPPSKSTDSASNFSSNTPQNTHGHVDNNPKTLTDQVDRGTVIDRQAIPSSRNTNNLESVDSTQQELRQREYERTIDKHKGTGAFVESQTQHTNSDKKAKAKSKKKKKAVDAFSDMFGGL